MIVAVVITIHLSNCKLTRRKCQDFKGDSNPWPLRQRCSALTNFSNFFFGLICNCLIAWRLYGEQGGNLIITTPCCSVNLSFKDCFYSKSISPMYYSYLSEMSRKVKKLKLLSGRRDRTGNWIVSPEHSLKSLLH